jgi:integrase
MYGEKTMVKQRKRGIKGAGSVYQRKSDGRWTGSFVVEETGKRKYVYAPADNNTERAAYELLKLALREQEQGTLAMGPNQKLKDYLLYWLEDVHRPQIYITTYANHRRIVHKHLIPALGHIELRKLNPQQVQQFYTDKGKQGLGAAYIKTIHSVLHNALGNAVKWRYVPFNVCDQVALPKVQRRKKLLLSKEQIIKLVDVANAHAMGPFIKLALMSGMRHGEMLALRWADIDFKTNILRVEHKVVRPSLAGAGFVEGDPKTEESIRKIVLPPFVADALKTHRERQQVIMQAAGDKWKNKDLVFCTLIGGYVDSQENLKRFRRVLEEAGLPPKMRVHDLRHNVATFLINVLKYPPNFVQALLGHSDIAITLREYTEEVDPETLRDMMNELNTLFGGTIDHAGTPDRKSDVVMFLADVFKYPPNFVQLLCDSDPKALQQVMNDLNTLLGGETG